MRWSLWIVVASSVRARWTMPVDEKQTEKNATMAHSSSSGLCFITANTQSIHPSLCSSTPTDMLCRPPSCHTTHKNEVRTRAHIRRAGGSTLSGVRNNSFWPSPACALKWSPWVAAYQRAAAIEWVVGITQPGFRTYTGHSKRPAHWAREIHGEADCARSCFDWDWMTTIPQVLWRWHSLRAYILHVCKGGACNLFWTSNCMWCLTSCYHRCSSNNKRSNDCFRVGLWRASDYCVGVNHWFPTLYK